MSLPLLLLSSEERNVKQPCEFNTMNMKLECDLSGIRKCMMSGLSLLLAGVLQAQNPIVQTCYTSDPAPMVHDGTLYVYTGHDEDHADFSGCRSGASILLKIW